MRLKKEREAMIQEREAMVQVQPESPNWTSKLVQMGLSSVQQSTAAQTSPAKLPIEPLRVEVCGCCKEYNLSDSDFASLVECRLLFM
jgi:hypothetical protein